MKIDYQKFRGSLPYASELFGVYQPMLGWKSRRTKQRYRRISDGFRRELISYITTRIYPDVALHTLDEREPRFDRFNIGTSSPAARTGVSSQLDSLVARATLTRFQGMGSDRIDERVWLELLSEEALAKTLRDVERILIENPGLVMGATSGTSAGVAVAAAPSASVQIEEFARRESQVAGVLHCLAENKMFSTLEKLFTPVKAQFDFDAYLEMQRLIDPLETFDPATDLDLVALSPVGIVHLFRQYFFEFDTFLGSPVQHVWLTPGATAELIEISSRKTTTERYSEASFESLVKTEKSLTEADELSDAIRSENQSNTKFGVSANVEGGVNVGIFTAKASATTSYGFDSNQKQAREQLHKQTRQQSTKLSTEIKKNYKSTLKTVTEVQDTTSKRYVLQNSTAELVNYELRRKMRQVGVQMQDIGTQLCWQTYVDSPGDALGIAKLVHVAEPADLMSIPQPEAPVRLEHKVSDVVVPFAYENVSGSDEMDVTFFHGSDEESWPDYNDRIVWIRTYQADAPEHGYTLDEDIDVMPQHSATCAAEARRIDASGKYEIRLNQVNFDDQPQINLKVTLRWSPPDQAAAEAKFKTDQQNYKTEKARLTKEAFVKAAQERITLASNIEPRNSMELREEERIVVYRKLIGQLLHVGINLENNKTRHILAELIDSMFDVDKMLFFVAPEWWRPRLHQGHQTFGSVSASGVAKTTSHIAADAIVSWGGVNEWRPDNYYITDESKPARFGSSLGWLLQLDGDNMRNAFLNAPWVKAVIPIRPGKELGALNWLSHASVEGADGLDAKYQAASAAEADTIAHVLKAYAWIDLADKQRYGTAYGPDAITVRDALKYLAITIMDKNRLANEQVDTEVDGEMKSYLPTDLVYEHGFYPLEQSFKAASDGAFEVFDQWVEILPTDQIVAVEVDYDPKTGMQK